MGLSGGTLFPSGHGTGKTIHKLVTIDVQGLRESMTLFEVDRVFWTRQDISHGEPLGEPRQKS